MKSAMKHAFDLIIGAGLALGLVLMASCVFGAAG